MFVLAELQDTVQIPPEKFKLKLADAIRDELNRKLANKVILNVGLCIAVKDIVYLHDSYILPGDGSPHTKVNFHCVVFRPRLGDILTGRIRSCTREGVYITLGFFDDILIPPESLQHPSRFEETESAWVWEYSLEDGDKHDLYMDIGEEITFRIVDETFEECLPSGNGPPKMDKKNVTMPPPAPVPKMPYRLKGSITESGLGVNTWWDPKYAIGEESETTDQLEGTIIEADDNCSTEDKL